MAKWTALYTLNEVVVDENDDYVREYTKELPHGDFLADQLIADWNKCAKEFMLELLNENCYDRFQSCNMRKRKGHDGTISLAIECVAKPGKQITGKVKAALSDFFEGQFSDGWGEGAFGLINVMTAPDGTRCYAD